MFAGTLVLIGYLYWLRFDRVEINSRLRITRAGRIYETDIQLKLWAMLGLGLASLILFQAFRRAPRKGVLVYLAVLMLLVGFPAAWFIWHLGTLDIPGLPVDTVSIALKVVGGLLFAQALLALGYIGILLAPGQSEQAHF